MNVAQASTALRQDRVPLLVNQCFERATTVAKFSPGPADGERLATLPKNNEPVESPESRG